VSALKKVEVTAVLHAPYLCKQTNPQSNIGLFSSAISLQRILFFFSDSLSTKMWMDINTWRMLRRW